MFWEVPHVEYTQEITRQIVKTAPGKIKPASLASMVEQIPDANREIHARRVLARNLGHEVTKVHNESDITNAAAKIAYGSCTAPKKKPVPGDDSCKTMIASFDLAETAKNIAVAVASFCPELVTDKTAVALTGAIMAKAYHYTNLTNTLILSALKVALQTLNKAGEGYTTETLLVGTRSGLDNLITVFKAGTAKVALTIAFDLSRKVSRKLIKVLEKRQKTWEAPIPVFTTILEDFDAPPPSYSG